MSGHLPGTLDVLLARHMCVLGASIPTTWPDIEAEMRRSLLIKNFVHIFGL